VFLEITAPLGALGLVDADALPPRTSVAFERTASVSGPGPPPVVIAGADVPAAVAAIRESRAVDAGTVVGNTGDGVVYRFAWADTPPELLACVRRVDGVVLAATAVDDAWTVELRFPDGDATSRFYDGYDDSDHPITIRHSSGSVTTRRGPRDALTPKQRTALSRAMRAGYFEVPRRTTTAELAGELDISDTALSQRLRRALSTLLRVTADRSYAVGAAGARDD
jgi:predicted DNA binding protein